MAQIGAAIGPGFSYGLLHAFAGIDGGALQTALERLADADILLVQGLPPESDYRFKHALIQDAAYENLLAARAASRGNKTSGWPHHSLGPQSCSKSCRCVLSGGQSFSWAWMPRRAHGPRATEPPFPVPPIPLWNLLRLIRHITDISLCRRHLSGETGQPLGRACQHWHSIVVGRLPCVSCPGHAHRADHA